MSAPAKMNMHDLGSLSDIAEKKVESRTTIGHTVRAVAAPACRVLPPFPQFVGALIRRRLRRIHPLPSHQHHISTHARSRRSQLRTERDSRTKDRRAKESILISLSPNLSVQACLRPSVAPHMLCGRFWATGLQFSIKWAQSRVCRSSPSSDLCFSPVERFGELVDERSDAYGPREKVQRIRH